MLRMLDIAGLGLHLDLRGEDVRIAGHYQTPLGQLPVAMEIVVHVKAGFAHTPITDVGYPAFHVDSMSATAVELSRYDASGSIRFVAGEPVRGEFTIAPREVALEALLRIVSSYALLRHGGLVLHSSAIGDNQGAHVFSGVSGAGKSTIAAMLCESWPVEQLSDELLIVRRRPNGWELIVSPFLGSTGLAHGAIRPLRSIDFLAQSGRNHRVPLGTIPAMTNLCRHVLTYAQDPESGGLLLDLVMNLVQEVPCYKLEFVKDASVGNVLELACG